MRLQSLTLLALLSAPATAAAAPTIAFDAPTVAREGARVEITVEVGDDAGGTPTYSWDLDGDGAFGERPGEPHYVIAAGTTDGPGELRVAVEATSGGETVTATHVVTIENVAPTIESEPPLTARVGSPYRYTLTVDDPAGDDDPIAIRLTSRPPGMAIEDASITWTPTPDQRGRTFPAIMRVDDGDGGEAMQRWDIEVAQNSAPPPPIPESPIERARVPGTMAVTLTVTNAEDVEEDALTYAFELSQVSRFDGEDVIRSAPVEEGAGGTTSWTTEGPLAPGLWYWRVWADDGMGPGRAVFAQLVVDDPAAALVDGSIPGLDGGPGGGGGCQVGPSRGAGLAWLSILALLAVRARRRPARGRRGLAVLRIVPRARGD